MGFANTQARNNKVSKNESDLKEFEDALEAHKTKGQENEDIEKKVMKSKKKAGARAKAKRALLLMLLSFSFPCSNPSFQFGTMTDLNDDDVE